MEPPRARRPKRERLRWPGETGGAPYRRSAFQSRGRKRFGRARAIHRAARARRFLEWISKETSDTLIRLVLEKETGKSRRPRARALAALFNLTNNAKLALCAHSSRWKRRTFLAAEPAVASEATAAAGGRTDAA